MQCYALLHHETKHCYAVSNAGEGDLTRASFLGPFPSTSARSMEATCPGVEMLAVLIQLVRQQSCASWVSSGIRTVDVSWQLDRMATLGCFCRRVLEVDHHFQDWVVSSDGRIIPDQILAQQTLFEIAVEDVVAAAAAGTAGQNL